MRIALLSFEYPPETGHGGIGTYTWHQARALRDLGHEVHVLAGAHESTGGLQHRDDDGVSVWRYRSSHPSMKAFRSLGKLRLWWTRNRLENAVSMSEGLTALLERHAVDIVEMPECGAEGLLVNRTRRVPAVIKFHSPAKLIMGGYDVARLDRALCPFLEQRAIARASHFTSASAFLAEEVKEKLGVSAPVQVVPNGIDLDWFDDAPTTNVRARFGIPEDRPMILFSGRLEPRKGIHLCREIIEDVLTRHEASFVFAGEDLFGYMSETLLPSLQNVPLTGSVHVLGKLDLADVRSCLSASDIFLIPSLWENCPYSCLEAMAARCAIVSSDAGGLPELVQHEATGLVAPSEDAGALAARVHRLLDDAELRARLGAAARSSIESAFNHLEIGRQSVAVYESALALPS